MGKKAAAVFVKMVSAAKTGFFYVQKRNPKNNPNKRALVKYDPVVRRHGASRTSKQERRRATVRGTALTQHHTAPPPPPLPPCGDPVLFEEQKLK